MAPLVQRKEMREVRTDAPETPFSGCGRGSHSWVPFRPHLHCYSQASLTLTGVLSSPT